jgi:hypothetical protein
MFIDLGALALPSFKRVSLEVESQFHVGVYLYLADVAVNAGEFLMAVVELMFELQCRAAHDGSGCKAPYLRRIPSRAYFG